MACNRSIEAMSGQYEKSLLEAASWADSMLRDQVDKFADMTAGWQCHLKEIRQRSRLTRAARKVELLMQAAEDFDTEEPNNWAHCEALKKMIE